jgi:DNA polymerase III gamma/tau subunit
MGDGAGLLYADTTQEELAAMQEQARQISPRWLLRAIRLFNTAALETKISFLPQLSLELAFLESLVEESPPEPAVAATTAPQRPSVLPAHEPAPGVTAAPRADAPPIYEASSAPSQPMAAREARDARNDLSAPLVVPGQTGNITLDVLKDNWRTVILANLRKVDPMAQGLLNSVVLLGVEGDEVIVEASSDLLKGRIEQAQIRSKVETSISQVVGASLRLRCVLKGEYRPRPKPKASPPPQANTPAPPTQTAPHLDDALSAPDDEPPADDDPMADEVRKLGGVRNHRT